MIVRTIITFALVIYTFFLVMRHNIHMFQLNGYKNDEHLRWIKKNLRQQWLLGFGAVVSIFRLFFPLLVLDILIFLVLLLEIAVYRALHRINTKKKLVYTARVKRLITTITIISVIPFVLVIFLIGIEPVTGVLMLTVSSQIFVLLIANIINHPMEVMINNHYINDAKRKLKDMPELVIIGVTGSFGKTSVKYYLQTLLQNRFNVLVTPGNFNTTLGVTRTIREYLKPTHEVFICEMGARRVGDIMEICDLVHPDHGIITSIGPQHLDTFNNIENIIKTKYELADAVPEKGMLFLNGDNEFIQRKASDYPNRIMYFSEHEGQGYYAKDVSVSRYGTDFTVVTPKGETERYQMKLIGMHNVINVVGAIAVANSMGIALKDLIVPVRRIQPVEHRMQMKEHGNVTIIDDAYNSNPIGSKAAVETLAMFDGIRILITPGMVELGDKEEEYNFNFGTYAAGCCDYILLVGKKRAVPIRNGVLSKGFPEKKCLVYDKLEDALAYAYTIKGEGHRYILLENDLPDNY